MFSSSLIVRGTSDCLMECAIVPSGQAVNAAYYSRKSKDYGDVITQRQTAPCGCIDNVYIMITPT